MNLCLEHILHTHHSKTTTEKQLPLMCIQWLMNVTYLKKDSFHLSLKTQDGHIIPFIYIFFQSGVVYVLFVKDLEMLAGVRCLLFKLCVPMGVGKAAVLCR